MQPNILVQAMAAGNEAAARRRVGPPVTLAGRLRSAIENNDSLDMLTVQRVATMLKGRTFSYASIGRAARTALLAMRADTNGHPRLSDALRSAARELLVGA